MTDTLTFAELLKHPNLKGGDIEFNSGPRYYGGNITRVRDYGNRATFHFTWSAAQVSHGWSRRAMQKMTLYTTTLTKGEREGEWVMKGIRIYLKGHGKVNESEVVPQIRHGTRESGRAPKKQRTLKDQGSLF